jgi:hypothetical protein
MSALIQVPLEHSQLFASERFKLQESVDDGLMVFRLSKVPERYCRGEIHLLMSFSCKVEGHLRRIAVQILRNPVEYIGRKSGFDDVGHDNQFAMFVHPIHIVDYPEGDIRTIDSLVRLKVFDGFSRSRVKDALYLSVVTGDFIFLDRLLFEDGKFDPLRMVSPLLRARQLPSKMVETRAQVMNDLSGENREPKRDNLALEVARCFHRGIEVVLSPHSASVFSGESLDFGIKIDDVLVGPI